MAFELVIFDLGGVAVECESDRLMWQVSQLLGRSFEEVQAAVYDPELLLPFELGRIKPEEYYAGLKARLMVPWTYDQFVTAWNNMLRENPVVTRLIPRLHDRYKLVALTNTNILHLRHIQTTFLSLSVFDGWVASCDVGIRKPNPQMYRLALEQVGVPADAAVYVDDRADLVEAGRAVGLSGIRFESGAQLERDLRALGLGV